MSTSNVVKTLLILSKTFFMTELDLCLCHSFILFHITCYMKNQVTILLNKIQATFYQYNLECKLLDLWLSSHNSNLVSPKISLYFVGIPCSSNKFIKLWNINLWPDRKYFKYLLFIKSSFAWKHHEQISSFSYPFVEFCYRTKFRKQYEFSHKSSRVNYPI